MDTDTKSPGISVGSACVGEPDRFLAVPAVHSRTYLVTLPRELVVEIINHCMGTKEQITRKKRDVVQLSLVTKFLREMCIPFIFTTMRIRTPYHKFLSKIQFIEGNRLLHIVQHLEINLFSETDREWKSETYVSLARLLSHMPRLNDLCLNLLHDPEFGHRLGIELFRQHVVLPVVKKLQYGFDLCRMTPGMQKVFPELDALHLNVGHQPHYVSLDDLFGLSSLKPKTISLRKARWEFEHVSEIHDFFPDVSKLILSGNIDHELMISELVPIFEPFRQLKVLALTDLVHPDDLNVDAIQDDLSADCELCNAGEEAEIDGVEINDACGNDHYWEAYELAQENHDAKEDQGENAKALFRMCPSLESVYFLAVNRSQAHRFTPVMDDSGDFEEVREEKGVPWPTISEYVRVFQQD
ncbi:hypothetical protein CGCSCA4_v005150 [Colletotrichum siamense]|uniref:Uncharacterized protein n=1 Tax=Colletotrichum siamense TaxID=690259 RepID=A0A9P5EXI9_COLSI|nr:hypothetical protein CGCSCA4_v005150 [Colletotrichum siamense]KAF4861310.1 hypothetical protein CGCSCA2_v004612 [Colletotrichum siamense]